MASLLPRSGPLGIRLAAHLLRRGTFLVTPARIQQFANFSADSAVDALFRIPALNQPEGPYSWQTRAAWLTTNVDSGIDSREEREDAVKAWLIQEMINDTSIRHKLVLFYHVSCFMTQTRFDSDRAWAHFGRLARMATGSFKELSYTMVFDPQVLRFLNNNLNQKNSPNEDFAREFLELYTILKGPQIGPGDYTTYTEYDVVTTARLFTGWRDNGDVDGATGYKIGVPVFQRHDTEDKTFSQAFGQATITAATDANDMRRELRDFVDLVFSQRETARNFVRRLYRFFVSDTIDTEIESDIVEPLATDLLANNYQVEPVLKRLLKSQHFFDEDDTNALDERVGAKIKSPLDIFIDVINVFKLQGKMPNAKGYPREHYRDFYKRWVFDYVLSPAEMRPFYPPSVFGFDAYSQAPGYSKNWFNSNTALVRYSIPDQILTGRRKRSGGFRGDIIDNRAFRLDVVEFMDQNIADPSDANQIMDFYFNFVMTQPPTDERKQQFTNLFLADLSPINWMFEWRGFKSSGDDSAVRIPLERLFSAVILSPEFQTM